MGSAPLEALGELSVSAPDLGAYRKGALGVVARVVPFDAALFHAFSPRVPLETGVVVGLEPGQLAESMRHWDEFASLFGAMRDRAHQEPVVTDEVLPKRARAVFREHVAKPVGQRSLCMVHLVVRGRFVSAIALFSKRERAFSDGVLARVRTLVPALAAGDALHQRLDGAPLTMAPTRLTCADQRLTPRQRELVEHVAMGQTNPQIAEALGLSVSGVRNHLARIFARLQAVNRADLVRLAVIAPSREVTRASRRREEWPSY